MALGVVEEQYIKDIADVLREKQKSGSEIYLNEMATIIDENFAYPMEKLSINSYSYSDLIMGVDVYECSDVEFERSRVGLVPENIVRGKSVLGIAGTAIPDPAPCTVLLRCNLTTGGLWVGWVNSDWSGYSSCYLAAQNTREITVGGNSILLVLKDGSQLLAPPSMDSCTGISAKYTYDESQIFHCGAGGLGTIWIQHK